MLITKRDAEYFLCALSTRARETSLGTRELELRVKLCEFVGEGWLEYLPYYENELVQFVAEEKEFERKQARYNKTRKQIELKRALLRAA
jgi:hypothetical protein